MTSDKEKIALKEAIKQACITIMQQRTLNASQAMQQAQDSANNQEKSSAGDKYETSRAMGQSDRDMNARQLLEAQKDLTFLNAIAVSPVHAGVTTGSVVQLGDQFFFIAIGLGAVTVAAKTVLVISYKSPLFEQLRNKKAGDKINFQNREQTLEELF